MEFYTPYIFALVIAWFASHVVKYIIASLRKEKNPERKFFGSGGMPSSHTATIAAVWAVVLLKDGWTSGLLGIASVVLVIVAYDAATLRRSVGHQNRLMKQLAQKNGVNTDGYYEARGHTVAEVAMGIVFGLLVGIVVYYGTTSWTW